MGQATKSTKVLLVDDNRQEYLLIGYLLSEAHGTDYRLIWCKHLQEALKYIEQETCDIVLLDYHWGGDSIGQAFLKKANAKNSRIPIVVMTDEIEADVDQRAIREGASDYLIKSRINSELLERTIRYAIERKQIEERLDHLAHYDHLTDLPNRMLFLDRLRHSINIAQREKNQFTLMFIDLNDFKGVNDSYGHEVGDKLLKDFSSRLTQVVRRSDTVARIGGDEFTVLLHNIGNPPKVMMLAQKIIDKMNQPFIINGHEFIVGCSIGIAIYPNAGDDEETLQRHADLAMYQAKQEPVSSYRFFSEALKHGVASEIKVQWDLHRDFYPAMQSKQFGVFYTPRLDIQTNRIIAIEVSPYWRHPKKGVLHYHQFSSISADKEMGKKLSEWLLAVGLYQFGKLRNTEGIKLVFNFEFQHFSFAQFVLSVKQQLLKSRISGSRVEFDLNQIAVDKNVEAIETCIDELLSLGVTFGVNSFGSELSSLLDLQRFPIRTLKLDKRFIKVIHKNKQDAQLVKAVIHFAHSIDKVVVAESVQTRSQLLTLASLKCDQCKGPAALGIVSFKQLQYILQGVSLSKKHDS